jgi:hypothetical protein
MLCEGVLVPTENDAVDVVKPGQNKLKQPKLAAQFRSQTLGKIIRKYGKRHRKKKKKKNNKITTGKFINNY